MNMYQGTRITDTPIFTGRAGRAWRVAMPPVGERALPDHDATVALYLVHVPGAHAFWDHWLMTVVHLRPIAGVKPPTKQFEDATHEFMIAALNPEYPLPPLVVDKDWRTHFLLPLDVMEQFTTRDDATAARQQTASWSCPCSRYLSPDQDWRVWWKQAIASTASHFNDGTHNVPLQ